MRKEFCFLFLITIVFSIVYSCEDSKEEELPTFCGIENPQENIEWLKSHLSIRSCYELYTVIYEETEYLGVNDCPEIADGILVFYDCEGNKICEFGGIYLGTTCDLPGFWLNFEENKKLIFTKEL